MGKKLFEVSIEISGLVYVLADSAGAAESMVEEIRRAYTDAECGIELQGTKALEVSDIEEVAANWLDCPPFGQQDYPELTCQEWLTGEDEEE